MQVRVAKKRFSLDPSAVGYQVDVEETVARAMQAGREGGLLEQLRWWMQRWREPLRLTVTARFEPTAVARTLTEWERSAIPDPPFSGGLRADGVKIVAERPRAGRAIDSG